MRAAFSGGVLILDAVSASATLCLPWVPCQVGFFTSLNTGEMFVARCKRWACAECGPRRVRRFVKRIAPAAWRYMVTLTVLGDDGVPHADNIKKLNHRWRSFSRWLKRNYGLHNYVWVNERGELHGRLHKHVLVESDYIEYGEAQEAAKRDGLGKVNFRPVESQRKARWYVSKYLSKSLDGKQWPKCSRRCQTTVPAEKSDEKFMFQRARICRPLSWSAHWALERATDEWLERECEREIAIAAGWSPQLSLNLLTVRQSASEGTGYEHTSGP